MNAAQPSTGIDPATAAMTGLGLLLAPIVGGTIAVPVYMIVLDLMNGRFGSSNAGNLLTAIQFGAFFGAYMGVIPALLLGTPVHVALLKTGKTHLLFYVGLGPVIALVSFLIVSPLYGLGFVWIRSAMDYLPIVLLCGAVGGVVFWLVRRPDRDTRPSESAP